ncbi:MAG: cellulase N-terminal Ig-like domain-containing protein [Firmicutes bacterium]|nr:cellulase N-terminal Ig-like domain-containing protein [Bacillota bacterium]
MKKHQLLVVFLIFVSMVFVAQAEIIVTEYGYLPFGKKEAMTTEKAESFSLVDKLTDREKFSGEKSEPLVDPATGETVYRLNFTDRVRGGDYYLTVGDLESRTVRIDSGAFNPVFVRAMKKITAKRGEYGWLDDNDEDNILLSSYMATRGLSYYETFMDRFGDGELEVPEPEQNNKIHDYADELIYGVRGLLKWYKEGSLESKDINELAAVVSAFAVSGRVLPKDSPELAKEVEQIALGSFEYLSAHKKEIRKDLWMLLLVELNLLTDDKEYETQFGTELEPILETGWAPINSEDLTGFAIGEMMKKSLESDGPIYNSYFERSVALLIAQDRDPYYRAVVFEPIEIEFNGIYLDRIDPVGIGSEGLYMIDLNEYYKTSVWAKAAQDQLHYLIGRNREGIDYLEDGSLETVFHIALLSANFKDSSKLTRSGQIVGGVFQITFYFVLIFAGITLWQKYSNKKAERNVEE